MRRYLLARAALAAAVAGGLTAAPPIGPVAAAHAAAAHAAAAASTEMQRDRVRWRAVSDARWEVRTAAAAALTDPRHDAITDFLAFGLRDAESLAATFERNNITEIEHALATSPTGTAVHRASKRALVATHDEKEEFVQRGLAAAQRQDADGDEERHEEVAKQVREDRDYVAELARADPGAQVRSAARFAANSGRDEDLAEFFSYYWAAGARLDDEAYRLRLAHLDAEGNAALVRLRAAALAAQAAEQAASGEAAKKLHVETVKAWTALAACAEGASIDWAAERDRAAAQADAWGRVADHARNAQSAQDWASVIARAGNSREAWRSAMEQAVKQAAEWRAIAEEARDNAAGPPAHRTERNR